MNVIVPTETRVALVLEDDERILDIVAKALSLAVPGVEIIKAKTSAEARDRIAGKNLHLFVLDVNLPDGNGIPFFRTVWNQYPRMAGIVMTGMQIVAYPEGYVSAAPIRFLQKPFDVRKLIQQASHLLSGTRIHSGRPELPVPDLIQMKCLGKESGSVRTSILDGSHAEIHISKGEMIHAEVTLSAGLSIGGEEAVGTILGWNNSTIQEVGFTNTEDQTTIWRPWQVVLKDAISRHVLKN